MQEMQRISYMLRRRVKDAGVDRMPTVTMTFDNEHDAARFIASLHNKISPILAKVLGRDIISDIRDGRFTLDGVPFEITASSERDGSGV